MARKLYGILHPDNKTILVIAFTAGDCQDELVRPVARDGESFDILWEEAKAQGYRCVELGINDKGRNKYTIDDNAPDPWELLATYEEDE
jgi:hypothetical protein